MSVIGLLLVLKPSPCCTAVQCLDCLAWRPLDFLTRKKPEGKLHQKYLLDHHNLQPHEDTPSRQQMMMPP